MLKTYSNPLPGFPQQPACCAIKGLVHPAQPRCALPLSRTRNLPKLRMCIGAGRAPSLRPNPPPYGTSRNPFRAHIALCSHREFSVGEVWVKSWRPVAVKQLGARLIIVPTMGSATEVLQDRWWSSETVAVVTGGNKGIGLEIVRRLALEGLTVILTARDETRGLKSAESLHAQGLQNVVFHKLDITNSESRTQFAEWLQKAYGGLDILVNNAAVFHNDNVYETAVETMKINYRGTIDVIEELLPLFRASPAGARIVVMSSWVGKLMNVNKNEVKQKLSDVTQFDQNYLDELEHKFLEACRGGNGAPNEYCNTAYRFSKILINSYGRLLTLRLASTNQQPDGHNIYVHNVHPGFVKTDMHQKLLHQLGEETYQENLASGKFGKDGAVSVEEGADTAVWLCLAPAANLTPAGRFWYKREELTYS